MTDLAIAEPGISTRGADAAARALKRGRCACDFFVLKTTIAAAYRTLLRGKLGVSQFGELHLVMLSPDRPLSSQQGIVLALQRNAFGARKPQKIGLQIVPFPNGLISLVDLALDPTAHPEDVSDCFSFLIPRATFDQLGDDHDANRIAEFAVRAGVAANDPIVLHLGSCLKSAIERHDGANDKFVGRVTTALNIHFARVCGGMHFPRPLVTGGLAPWQLRLARDTINSRFEGELSLEQLAHERGLSVNHFAEAFARSTGISPHRWLMHWRVDVAKDLMLSTDSSLVAISLKYGFSGSSPKSRRRRQDAGVRFN